METYNSRLGPAEPANLVADLPHTPMSVKLTYNGIVVCDARCSKVMAIEIIRSFLIDNCVSQVKRSEALASAPTVGMLIRMPVGGEMQGFVIADTGERLGFALRKEER